MNAPELQRPSISVAAHAAHRQPQPWRATNHIATFVRCLRLLDLDRREDWPGITEETFSTKPGQQNLQSRIKCVEWSLYRLFEVYDRDETQKKLRPFFPPQAPLQSLNLRAALFRSLTELKKNGVLGKDVTLRKTMLDECKGERFEEILSTFAMGVLRQRGSSNPYISKSLSNLETGGNLTQQELLSIVLAHRVSLRARLNLRDEFRRKAQKYSDFLTAQQEDLKQRTSALNLLPTVSEQESYKSAEELLRNEWTGDDRWADIIVQGRCKTDTPFQKQSFEASWAAGFDIEGDDPTASKSLADELDERIATQAAKLRRWKAFQTSLENVQKPKTKDQQRGRTSGSTDSALPAFEEHKALHPGIIQPTKLTSNHLIPAHKAILASMEEGLSALRDRTKRSDFLSTGNSNSALFFSRGQLLPPQIGEDISSPAVDESPSTLYTSTSKINSDFKNENTLYPSQTLLVAEGEELDVPVNLRVASDQRRLLPTATAMFGEEKLMTDQPGQRNNDGSTPREIFTTAQTPERSIPTTLLERTQMSMSASKHERDNSTRVQHTLSSPSQAASMPPPKPRRVDATGTLLERTRQSMSLLPNPPPRKSVAKHPRPSQASFPINQFETPATKPKAANIVTPVTSIEEDTVDPSPHASGTSTPRASLFSDEADYASVFKSRPRVALSPPASSPERGSALGFEDDDGDDNNDEGMLDERILG